MLYFFIIFVPTVHSGLLHIFPCYPIINRHLPKVYVLRGNLIRLRKPSHGELILDGSTDAQSAACSKKKSQLAPATHLGYGVLLYIYQEGVRVNLINIHNTQGMFFHLIKELRKLQQQLNRCVHTHTSVFTNVLFTYCHRQMCSST